MAFQEDAVLDPAAIQSLFSEQYKLDSQAVLREMESPAVLRLRAQDNQPVSFRMLALRLSRMSAAKELLKERLQGIVEDRLPLGLEKQRERLLLDVHRALEMCIRVLESSDNHSTTAVVTETAENMSHSIGAMSQLLRNTYPSFADDMARASLKATQIGQQAPSIAAEMKNAYDSIRAQITAVAPPIAAMSPAEFVELERDERSAAPSSVAG